MTQLVATAAHAEFRQLTCVDAGGRRGLVLGRAHARPSRDGRGRRLRRGRQPARRRGRARGDGRRVRGRPTATISATASSPRSWPAWPPAARRAPCARPGMLIVDAVAWPVADLRVDWHDEPIHELARLWRCGSRSSMPMSRVRSTRRGAELRRARRRVGGSRCTRRARSLSRAQDRHAEEAGDRGRRLGRLGERRRQGEPRSVVLRVGRSGADDGDARHEPHGPQPHPCRPGSRVPRRHARRRHAGRADRACCRLARSGARGRAREGDRIRPARGGQHVRLHPPRRRSGSRPGASPTSSAERARSMRDGVSARSDPAWVEPGGACGWLAVIARPAWSVKTGLFAGAAGADVVVVDAVVVAGQSRMRLSSSVAPPLSTAIRWWASSSRVGVQPGYWQWPSARL